MTVAVWYVPPDSYHSTQLQRQSPQVRFAAFTDQLRVAATQGHVLLAGDFNARVGSRCDTWVTEFGDSIPPDLHHSDNTVNAHGRKLLQLCSNAGRVLCTGRTVGDVPAKPSFKARVNTAPSRLDHILVDPELFPFVDSCRVGPCRPDSDHLHVEMRLLLDWPLEPALQGLA